MKFRIFSDLTVVQRRQWTIEAESADAAREAFEENSDNACFMMEETVDIIGDETIVQVEIEP